MHPHNAVCAKGLPSTTNCTTCSVLKSEATLDLVLTTSVVFAWWYVLDLHAHAHEACMCKCMAVYD